jgi:hypothetical protein
MYYRGQKVVCVNDEIEPGDLRGQTKLHGIVKDREYTVHSFERADGRYLVTVEEATGRWDSRRFKPVQKKSTETGMAILRGLLDTKKTPELVE